MLQSCPSTERLLESISFPGERGFLSLARLKAHTFGCRSCKKNLNELRDTWKNTFQPEPEIATSLLRVYSRLQRDETLILKGWKLEDLLNKRPSSSRLFLRTWAFPAGVAFAAIVSVLWFSPYFGSQETEIAATKQSQVPLSSIRVRDGNAVRVHYVQPELLHSMEFETVSTP